MKLLKMQRCYLKMLGLADYQQTFQVHPHLIKESVSSIVTPKYYRGNLCNLIAKITVI